MKPLRFVGLYSILQILVGNIHSTKQFFKTYHQQKPVLIYLKSERCNMNIRKYQRGVISILENTRKVRVI